MERDIRTPKLLAQSNETEKIFICKYWLCLMDKEE